MGFLPDIKRILKLVPQRRQTLFFSATMPPEIRQLSQSILKDPVTVQIGMIAPAETVSHALYPVTNNMRKALLLSMLKQTATGRVLIFTRTKRRARFLARDLEKKGYNAAALQGNMSQNKRQKAINGFRNGKYDILVATDVASRGIDVDDISHVINFDMPDTVDAYTHRIGRTGRKEESGEAFTLATPDDDAQVRAIEKLLGSPIERRRLPNFNYGDFRPESQFQSNGYGRNGQRNGSGRNGSANNRRPGGRKKNNQSRHYRPRPSN
jgi:ATP-dependent RNA helicase RhlE